MEEVYRIISGSSGINYNEHTARQKVYFLHYEKFQVIQNRVSKT